MIETVKPQAEEAATERKRRHSVIKIAAVLVFAAAVVVTALAVYNIGGGFSADSVKRTWTVITGSAGNTRYAFEDGFDAVFADLGNAVVAAGSSGVIVYDGDGHEVARDVLTMQNPVIASGGGIAISYGVGGRGIRIADMTGIITSLTFENNIISCSAGASSGMFSAGTLFAVCTESSDNYKGKVTVYRWTRGDTEKIYEWFSGEGYVLSAEIAPKNNEFAVLTLTPSGGRIVLLNRESLIMQGEYINNGAAIIEMGYLSSGTLIARTADGLIAIDKTGTGTEIYSFAGKTIAGYCNGGGTSVAMYFESAAGGNTSGELVVTDERGSEFGRMNTSRKLVWLAADADRVAVLWSDGLDIYDRSLRLRVSYPEASGMLQAYPRGGARAVVFGNRLGVAFSGSTE